MAIEKLFQVLVVGGVTLGTQACASKQPQKSEAPTAQKEVTKTADANSEEKTSVEPSVAEPAPRSRFTGSTSKGEKCEDICYEQSSGELICSEMCCWLTAVECCPNYVPIPKEEETPKEEDE